MYSIGTMHEHPSILVKCGYEVQLWPFLDIYFDLFLGSMSSLDYVYLHVFILVFHVPSYSFLFGSMLIRSKFVDAQFLDLMNFISLSGVGGNIQQR